MARNAFPRVPVLTAARLELMPPSRLLGRDAPIASLIRHLRAERPLVLSGFGGVGGVGG